MPKLKLLIAEDSKFMQLFYEAELSEVLFEIRIVPDGEQALAEYKSWQPDIIVLDIHMPLMNGYQVLKTLRDTFEDKLVTIIIVTTDSEKENIVACAKLGIQGYMVKPLEPDTINKAILTYHRQKK